MLLRICHRTLYTYRSPVTYGLQQLRLSPRSRRGLDIRNWSLEVAGAVREAEFVDQHDNIVTLVSLTPGATEISATCEGLAETADLAGVVGPHEGRAPLWHYLADTGLTRAGPLVRALATGIGQEADGEIARLHRLSARILETTRYAPGATSATTNAEEALQAGHGVCQDHTHIFLAAARLLGFPARYVSGYLLMPDRPLQDAGHAWAEAHVDGLGWVGFDVSNQICPDAHYVPVAFGLDASEAAPIRGHMLGADTGALSVALQVQQQ